MSDNIDEPQTQPDEKTTDTNDVEARTDATIADEKPKSMSEAFQKAREKLQKADIPAARQNVEEPENETKDSKPEKEATNNKPEPQKEQPKDDIKPPGSWSKEQLQHWDKLPFEAKQAVKQRETELRKALTKANTDLNKLADAAKPFHDFEQEIVDLVRTAGGGKKVQTLDYLKALVSADKAARTDPVQYAKTFIERMGIDLKALADGEVDHAFDHRGYQAQKSALEAEAKAKYFEEQLQAIQTQLQAQQEQVRAKESIAPIANDVSRFEQEVLTSYSAEQYQAAQPYLVQVVQQLKAQSPQASNLELLEAGWKMTVQALKLPKIGSGNGLPTEQIQPRGSLKSKPAKPQINKVQSLADIVNRMRA